MPIITAVNSPVASLPANNATPGAESPRQRAINAFTQAAGELKAVNSQAEAVRNPSKVSPEEMSAVRPPSQKSGSVDNTETAPESASPEATKSQEEPLSTQYAVLARKEKALRAKQLAQEQAYKQREAQLYAKEESLKLQQEQRVAEYQQKYIPKDRIQTDPLAVLAELGLSNEQITQLALNAPSQQDIAYKAEIESLRAELRSVREETTGIKKSFEDRDTQSYNQAIGQIRKDAQRLVDSDPSYESIKQAGQVGEVVKLIERTFKEDGEIMDVAEAAKLVEDELSERLYQLSNKISKVKSRFAPKAESAPEAPVASNQKPQVQMKTLTNSVSSSRPLSAKERAILAFKGEKF